MNRNLVGVTALLVALGVEDHELEPFLAVLEQATAPTSPRAVVEDVRARLVSWRAEQT